LLWNQELTTLPRLVECSRVLRSHMGDYKT
jgi:hypothetical protein